MSKKRFLNALQRKGRAVGSATSIVTLDLMDKVGASFPEAHLDEDKMTRLAFGAVSEIGFDNVMPLFSVWHESAALGCKVDWGEKHRMPDCEGHLYDTIDDSFTIPKDFLRHPACQTPLKSIAHLRKLCGEDACVMGKVFGPWTQGYHLFGVQDFLMATLLEPDNVKRAMDKLKKVTIAFAKAQIEAGAEAICLADHCTRDLCSPDAYKEFLRDCHAELSEAIDAPIVLHICGDTSDRLPFIKTTGIECFHFDSKAGTDRVRAIAGDKLALMGGTSNIDIIWKGDEESIRKDIEEKIGAGIDILGPECAVPINAPLENLKLFARIANEMIGV